MSLLEAHPGVTLFYQNQLWSKRRIYYPYLLVQSFSPEWIGIDSPIVLLAVIVAFDLSPFAALALTQHVN